MYTDVNAQEADALGVTLGNLEDTFSAEEAAELMYTTKEDSTGVNVFLDLPKDDTKATHVVTTDTDVSSANSIIVQEAPQLQTSSPTSQAQGTSKGR